MRGAGQCQDKFVAKCKCAEIFLRAERPTMILLQVNGGEALTSVWAYPPENF